MRGPARQAIPRAPHGPVRTRDRQARLSGPGSPGADHGPCAARMWRGPGAGPSGGPETAGGAPLPAGRRWNMRPPRPRGRPEGASSRRSRPPGVARHAPKRRRKRIGRPCRIAKNPFFSMQLSGVKVPVVHSRRTTLSSDRHFFWNGVLTGRKGLAYKPPIDAAPRFTGSIPRPLNFSPSCIGIRLLVQPEGSFSRPCCIKGGSRVSVPVL